MPYAPSTTPATATPVVDTYDPDPVRRALRDAYDERRSMSSQVPGDSEDLRDWSLGELLKQLSEQTTQLVHQGWSWPRPSSPK